MLRTVPYRAKESKQGVTILLYISYVQSQAILLVQSCASRLFKLGLISNLSLSHL